MKKIILLVPTIAILFTAVILNVKKVDTVEPIVNTATVITEIKQPVEEVEVIPEIVEEVAQEIAQEVAQEAIQEVTPVIIEEVKSIDEYIKQYFGEYAPFEHDPGTDEQIIKADFIQTLLINSVKIVVKDFPEKFTEENRKESFEFLYNHYNDPQYFGSPNFARMNLVWYKN